MNTKEPHDIIDVETLKGLSPLDQADYIQLPRGAEGVLAGLTVKQRAEWLASNRHGRRRIQAIARRVRDAKRKLEKLLAL